MSESRRRFRYSVVVVADSQEQADLTMEMRLGPREARTADSCMWRPETEFRAGAGTEEVRPRPSTRSGHPTREASRQPQLPVESAAVVGPVDELTFDPRRAPWVTDAEVEAAAATMYDEVVAELDTEDRECAMVTARLMLEAASPLIVARVRADERRRAVSELQRSFKDTPGVDWGDVIEVSRRILAAGSAVPVAPTARRTT